MFKRTIVQYERMRKRNAYLDQYKREAMFAEGLEELDSSRYCDVCFTFREVVQDLISEYEACESADYVDWVNILIYLS